MEGKWKVYGNPFNGYQIGRLKDAGGVLHSGNLEFWDDVIYPTKEEAQVVIEMEIGIEIES